ncbi:MAG: hypothetical protein ACRDGM_13630, partial [bacterium]
MTLVGNRELGELASDARRRRRVPSEARCAVCRGVEHLTLRPDGDVRCYGHLRSEEPARELDHWASVTVLPDAEIPLDANAHRDITGLRRLLGFDDLPPVDG